jgi:heme A synthase
MNQEQFTGVVRHVLGAVGAYVVAKGITDESTMIQATGAIATIAAVVWSIIEKRNRR